MKKKNEWKKASFTVEAAVIVPMSLIMLALLLGFDYYTHQSGWSTGLAGEAALYSLQRFADGSEPEEKAQERADQRMSQAPLITGDMEQNASGSSDRIKVSWSASVLPAVFGDLYETAGEISAGRTDPVKFKQSQWVIGDIINE